ncbi:MAG: hypothetical protein ACYC27_01385 [Armatimonadota bacterium]
MAQRLLKTLDYGGLLDEAFDLYKNNFLLLIGIAAVVLVPLFLLESFTTGNQNDSSALLSILYQPANSIVGAAITYAVSRRYLEHDVTILSSYGFLKKRFWAFAGTMLLTSAITSLGFLLLIIPGILFTLWYTFVSQVFVIEGLTGSDARGRSKDITQYNIGKLIIIILLVGIMVFIISGLPIHVIRSIANDYIQIATILSRIFYILITPIYITIMVLLYYDMRVRYEGFDIEMLAQSLSEPEISAVEQ